MTEAEVLVLLRERFPEPAYALLPHVREGTGAYAGRTADAVAMGVWPSRGFELHGFEIKCSRSDWLREVRDPAKADGIFAYMDRWWLVTSDKKFVFPGELPAPWGWLAVQGSQVRIQVEAPKLDPKPLTHAFLAAILRQASRQLFSVGEDTLAIAIREAELRGYERGVKAATRDAVQSRSDEETRLKRAVAAFKEASGIDLLGAYDWDAGRIGDIVTWWTKYQQPGTELLNALRQIETSTNSLLGAIEAARSDAAVPEVFRR